MAPNLAYVDSVDGSLLDAYHPPAALHQLSIRHLAISSEDTVCVAMQWEGPANVHPPLVAIHRGEERLRLLSAPGSLQSAMRNYCGSVCGDSSGEWFAVSAPHGNLITFWSTARGDCLGRSTVVGGCGIAAGIMQGQFTVSSGQGDLFTYQVTDESTVRLEKKSASLMRWDNHMASLTASTRGSPPQRPLRLPGSAPTAPNASAESAGRSFRAPVWPEPGTSGVAPTAPVRTASG